MPRCGLGEAPQSQRSRQNSRTLHTDALQEKNLFFVVDKYKFNDLYDWKGDGMQPLNCGGNGKKAQTGSMVVCNEKKIALFRYGSVVFAIDERCPHMGGPLHLGNLETVGEAQLLCVACPWHKWRIELSTGKLRMPSGRGVCNQVYPNRLTNE